MLIPQHVGIIMDGNGRWAKKRNLPKIMGHRAGGDTVDRVVEASAKKGIKALTLYSFSTENWKRPQNEVNAIMELFKELIITKIGKLCSNNIRARVIGRKDGLSHELIQMIKELEEKTSTNTGMILALALNYGGRQEIVDAAKSLFAQLAGNNRRHDDFDVEDLDAHMYTKDFPPLDLVIRTSGEMRLSNFLIWQAAYAEIYVTDVLWPDFNEHELDMALESFSSRERRFGG
ncbi:MAG: isoprenyl transferase [Candidatus Omnitrophica bacterium]|nr:isoprenyl transferase [Candidatus Omnitrophota bacterium]